MAIVLPLVHFILLSAFQTLLFFPISNPNTITKPQRLVMKLIHQNCVLHPSYNPNDTISDRARRDITSSRNRLAYLQAKTRISGTSDVHADLYPSLTSSVFCANFSIGNPPIPQLAVIDTGSNIMWVQCSPCEDCFKQTTPMLDPSESSTYSDLNCDSLFCNYSNRMGCNWLNLCSFGLEYMDNSRVEGVIATEQLTFMTQDEGFAMVPDIVFGCTHKSGASTDGRLSGAIGLGTEPISLASQLGGKFSYCIGSITDPHYIYNQLVLGDESDFEGYPTPFERIKGSYYVTLEGISVGEKRLDISPSVFRRSSNGYGGVIIDSGSTVTWLVKDGYEILSQEVYELMNGVLQRIHDKSMPWSLCYSGTVSQSLSGFPTVTFHFAWGADLVSDGSSFFYQKEVDVFCMAVHMSNPYDVEVFGDDEVSTIGILAQQNYNVGYDLVGKKIYLQRIDCELLNE